MPKKNAEPKVGLSVDMFRDLRIIAAVEGKTMKEVAEDAINYYFDTHKKRQFLPKRAKGGDA